MKKIKKIAAGLMAAAIAAAGMGSLTASGDNLPLGAGVSVQVGLETYIKAKSYVTYVRSSSTVVMHRKAKNIHCQTNALYGELWFPDQYSKYSNINFNIRTNPADSSQKIKTVYSTNGASLGDKSSNTKWKSFWLQNQC